MAVEIRRAEAVDQLGITAMVHAERLNPHGLDWRNFVVADEAGRLIAAAQIRRHGGGAHELGSLVVEPSRRGQGLAARLIERLLMEEASTVYVVTGRRHASHYARWGFAPLPFREAPAAVRRNYLLGQTIGALHAVATRRPINHLMVLRRQAEPETAAAIGRR